MFQTGESMRFLVALITRVPLPVLLAACLTAQTAAPPPSYRFSAKGAAPGIPVEVVANGLVLMHAKVNDHPDVYKRQALMWDHSLMESRTRSSN